MFDTFVGRSMLVHCGDGGFKEHLQSFLAPSGATQYVK